MFIGETKLNSYKILFFEKDLDFNFVNFKNTNIAVDSEWLGFNSGVEYLEDKDVCVTVQLCCSNEITIVFIEKNTIPKNLISIFEDFRYKKIFHSYRSDQSVFQIQWNSKMNNFECTKLISSFLTDNISLKSILKTFLNINLDKSWISEWIGMSIEEKKTFLNSLIEKIKNKDPISEYIEALSYVCGDVIYIEQLYNTMFEKLSIQQKNCYKITKEIAEKFVDLKSIDKSFCFCKTFLFLREIQQYFENQIQKIKNAKNRRNY